MFLHLCNTVIIFIGVIVNSKLSSKIALTSGDWEVLGHNIWVNEERQLVYFVGLRESPLEKHLYVVSLERPGEIRLLTRPGFSYTVDLNKVLTFNTKIIYIYYQISILSLVIKLVINQLTKHVCLCYIA